MSEAVRESPQARDATDWSDISVAIHAYRRPMEPMDPGLFRLFAQHLLSNGFTSNADEYTPKCIPIDTMLELDGWILSLTWPSHNVWLAARRVSDGQRCLLNLSETGFDPIYLFRDTLQGQAAINGHIETVAELDEQLDRLERDGWAPSVRCDQVDRSGRHWEYAEYRGFPVMKWSACDDEAKVGCLPPESVRPAAFRITGDLWREINRGQIRHEVKESANKD